MILTILAAHEATQQKIIISWLMTCTLCQRPRRYWRLRLHWIPLKKTTRWERHFINGTCKIQIVGDIFLQRLHLNYYHTEWDR